MIRGFRVLRSGALGYLRLRSTASALRREWLCPKEANLGMLSMYVYIMYIYILYTYVVVSLSWGALICKPHLLLIMGTPKMVLFFFRNPK